MNGKGSSPRPVNLARYGDNYDRIFRPNKEKKPEHCFFADDGTKDSDFSDQWLQLPIKDTYNHV